MWEIYEEIVRVPKDSLWIISKLNIIMITMSHAVSERDVASASTFLRSHETSEVSAWYNMFHKSVYSCISTKHTKLFFLWNFVIANLRTKYGFMNENTFANISLKIS